MNTVRALIADLLTDPTTTLATDSRPPPGESGESGESPRKHWASGVANAGESVAKSGEFRPLTPGEFATIRHDSPSIRHARDRTVAGDSPLSPLSPTVPGESKRHALVTTEPTHTKHHAPIDPPPLATASYAEVLAWLDAAGETDPKIRREILTGYGFHDFQYPDSGRRACRQCANLEADGGCRAARRGQIPNASRHYTWPGGIDALHRCIGYRPGLDDHAPTNPRRTTP